MTVSSFMFRRYFSSKVTDENIEEAIQVINVSWRGISTLWSTLAGVDRDNKINLCYNYLVAWWLADAFPSYVTGIFTTGGVPLKEKKIGSVDLRFKDSTAQSGLAQLETNYFGLRAEALIKSAPETYKLY